MTLFSGVGTGANTANFTNTVFDDNAATPIQNGSAPFFATFNPQQSLATAFAGGIERPGDLDAGHHRTPRRPGHRHAQQLVADLPEAAADQRAWASRAATTSRPASGSSRWASPTPLSSQHWTAVGPASIGGGGGAGESSAARSGRVGGLAIDPSDPSGNTVYVAGASGGVWKTTNFLTTNPAGPTYIPLTDFGPTFGVNIGSIAVFGRNNDPNQSIIIAATGEGDTGTPGRRLPDLDGRRRDLDPVDSTNNVDASGNSLPIASAARDRDVRRRRRRSRSSSIPSSPRPAR